MKRAGKIVDFMIQNNFVLGISASSYCLLTYLEFNLKPNYYLLLFLFFATVFSYTVLKKIKQVSDFFIPNFTVLSLCFYLGFLVFLITKINAFERWIFFIGFLLTILYGYSFLGIKKWREIPIIKIVVVAIVWVLTTCFVVIYSQVSVKEMFWICLSRWLFFLAIMILFEIVDLKTDSKYLRTLPQIFGVSNAKRIALILFMLQFIIFYFLKFSTQNVLLSILGCLFLYTVTENSPNYITRFWLESIPFFLILLCAVL